MAVLSLVGGLVMFAAGVLGLRNWQRVNAAMIRFSDRVGWPTDEDSTAPKFVFAVLAIVGASWIIGGVVNLT